MGEVSWSDGQAGQVCEVVRLVSWSGVGSVRWVSWSCG